MDKQPDKQQVLLDQIHQLMTDTFYERQHGRYLVRKEAVCGADLDVLLEKIEEFLGMPKL